MHPWHVQRGAGWVRHAQTICAEAGPWRLGWHGTSADVCAVIGAPFRSTHARMKSTSSTGGWDCRPHIAWPAILIEDQESRIEWKRLVYVDCPLLFPYFSACCHPALLLKLNRFFI